MMVPIMEKNRNNIYMDRTGQHSFFSSVTEGDHCVQRVQLVISVGYLLDVMSLPYHACALFSLRRVGLLYVFDDKRQSLFQRVVSVLINLGIAWWSHKAVLYELLMLCAAIVCMRGMQTRMVKTDFAAATRIAGVMIVMNIMAYALYSAQPLVWTLQEICINLINIIGIYVIKIGTAGEAAA